MLASWISARSDGGMTDTVLAEARPAELYLWELDSGALHTEAR